MKEGITGQLEIAGTLGILKNYIGFSPKHPNAKTLINMYDQGIKKLRESGQLNQILSRYGVEDWVKNNE